MLVPKEASRAQALRFATTPDAPFIKEYAQVVRSGPETSISRWIIENYKRMTEGMFFDSGWDKIDPEDLIPLRIFTPDGVFTDTAKSGLFSQVGSSPEWAEVAKTVFVRRDSEFLGKLKPDMQAEAQTLLGYAYKKGIRPKDPSITV